MIRLAAILFALGLACVAQAQIPNVKIVGFAKQPDPPFITNQANTTQVTSLSSTVTFPSMAIGSAASDRYAIAACGGNSTGTPTSVTIGGVGATVTNVSAFSSTFALVAYALVTSGTTANVVITMPSSGTRWGCSTFRMEKWLGANKVSATATNTLTLTLTVSIPRKGAGVGGAFSTNTSIGDPAIVNSWNLLAEYQDTFFSFSSMTTSAANISTPGSQAISTTTSATAATTHAGVAVVFYN